MINDEEDSDQIPVGKQTKVEEVKTEQATPAVSAEVQAKREMVLLKKNLIELHDLDDLQLELVQARKQIKNQSVVSGLIGSYDDRYLSMVQLNGELSLVVLRKVAPLAESQRKFTTAARSVIDQTKQTFEKQLREYHQLQSPAATNPGDESANPYLNDLPERV